MANIIVKVEKERHEKFKDAIQTIRKHEGNKLAISDIMRDAMEQTIRKAEKLEK